MICWFPLGFVLLATQRYYKTKWYLMWHTHNLIGLFVTGITLMTCLQVYAHVNWTQGTGAHAILGLFALLLTLFVGITGMITSAMMQWYKGDKAWAERDKVYYVAKIHRYSSYFMLILGNAVCSGGTATYFSLIGYGIWGTFAVCTSIFFLAMVAIHELILRRYNKKNFTIVEGDQLLACEGIQKGGRVWTPNEIEEAVAEGDSLVVCDNLVLRVDGYERIHPGGKFVIEKNFGRDIAKFYYGNYALTNGKLTMPHTHSG